MLPPAPPLPTRPPETPRKGAGSRALTPGPAARAREGRHRPGSGGPNRGGWGDGAHEGQEQRGGDPRPSGHKGEEGRQPISSNRLPFVSFTNFSTNGIESAANTV